MRSRQTVVRGRARGLSLIELMVAILLSSILVLGLVEVFAASRSAYQLSQGVARAQENSRFAMDFLLRDLRMVGHTGCVNDQALTMAGGGGITSHFDPAVYQLRFDVSVQGYEATGTAPAEARTLPATPIAGAEGAWVPNLPTELTAGSNPPIAGSDVIVLRYLAPIGTTLASFTPGTTAVAVPGAGGGAVATEFATTRSLFALADCQRASVFQATAINATTGAVSVGPSGLNAPPAGGGGLSGLESYAGGQAVLYRAETVAYYVGVNSAGNPALYRRRWEAAPNGPLGVVTEEMVEGIESLQLLFGEDSAAVTAAAPTGYINAMSTAASIGNPIPATAAGATAVARWRRVGAVQLGILSRSIQPSGNAERPVESLLGVALTPPNDTHYRSSYETTVALRNRMFGN